MNALLENTKEELSKARHQLGERIPTRRTGPAAVANRTANRTKRTAKRAEKVGRRTTAAVSAAVGGARQLAEERVRSGRRAERRRRRKRLSTAAAAGAAGGAGAYFLDPNQGKRRRHVARDKLLALFRRAGGRAERAGRYGASAAAGKAKGAAAAAAPEKPAPNDEALADRVRSEIFRPADAPKGSVNVNVEGGIVYLRGEADEKQARKLATDAKSVDGVKEVKNLITTG